jgi:hypothetical protein
MGEVGQALKLGLAITWLVMFFGLLIRFLFGAPKEVWFFFAMLLCMGITVWSIAQVVKWIR